MLTAPDPRLNVECDGLGWERLKADGRRAAETLFIERLAAGDPLVAVGWQIAAATGAGDPGPSRGLREDQAETHRFRDEFGDQKFTVFADDTITPAEDL